MLKLLGKVPIVSLLAPALFLALILGAMACGSAAEPMVVEKEVVKVVEVEKIVEVAVTPTPAASSSEIGIKVGNMVPEFTLNLIDGKTLTSVQLLQDGRPTFLHFFKPN